METILSIKLLVTGGTIDKQYKLLNGELGFDKTAIPSMLTQGRSRLNLSVEVLFSKDSLEITDNDRALIQKKCLDCEQDKIIISHGTDTMVDTAKLLGLTDIKDKTIVLVGAMIPFSINYSDALFNLGGAVIAVQHLPQGVYIVMNGYVFLWNESIKNKEKGVFEKPNSTSLS